VAIETLRSGEVIHVVQLLLSCIQLPQASAGGPGKRVRHPNRPRTLPGMKNKISFGRSRKNYANLSGIATILSPPCGFAAWRLYSFTTIIPPLCGSI